MEFLKSPYNSDVLYCNVSDKRRITINKKNNTVEIHDKNHDYYNSFEADTLEEAKKKAEEKQNILL